MYRPTFAIVDARAIRHNVAWIRSQLKPLTKLMIAVKANGYGHGVMTAVRAAKAGGADAFALATLDEALFIRRAGVTDPILILGSLSGTAMKVASEHDIEVPWTGTIPETDLPTFTKPLKVHIKLDTGMSRLGFREESLLLDNVLRLKERRDIEIAGVFTHLANADAKDAHHAADQIQRFHQLIDVLRKAGIEAPLVHAGNSAGALLHRDWHFDMVRVGISTYGYSPNPDDFPIPNLRPALHVYSGITRVAPLAPGDTIGYGATYTAPRPMRVATLAIGYADGYPRILSNRGYVLIRGRKAPIVGRVCMDQVMVDVTEIDAQVGDIATIYGAPAPEAWSSKALETRSEAEQEAFLVESFAAEKSSGESLSLDVVAHFASTISYELMCLLGNRVPRLVVHDTL